MAMFRHRTAGMTRPPSDASTVGSHAALRVLVRQDYRISIIVPIARLQTAQAVPDVDRRQNVVGTCDARNWLCLQEWIIGAKPHRRMRSGKPKVGEQRSKPTISLDHPLIQGESAGAGEIGGSA